MIWKNFNKLKLKKKYLPNIRDYTSFFLEIYM